MSRKDRTYCSRIHHGFPDRQLAFQSPLDKTDMTLYLVSIELQNWSSLTWMATLSMMCSVESFGNCIVLSESLLFMDQYKKKSFPRVTLTQHAKTHRQPDRQTK